MPVWGQLEFSVLWNTAAMYFKILQSYLNGTNFGMKPYCLAPCNSAFSELYKTYTVSYGRCSVGLFCN
jgi:hypothetical protein